ncbi:protein of unknown function [Methylorubrum extorquens]|uniref:Uncharacterized protein n=1 Tax=Methylorubrum extorquens TaxID=408 RepID=A0A2N9AI41_METEX|nr:protein of unknown function [Methylorubrum extorquens]
MRSPASTVFTERFSKPAQSGCDNDFLTMPRA